MPFKDFAAGAVLTAAQVDDYLMRQAVMTFADSSERGTAIGTAVAEGMVSFLLDSDSMEYYDGAAWQPVSNPGDITAVTAGTALTGGGSTGDVTLNVDLAAVGSAVSVNLNQVVNTLTSSTATAYTIADTDAGTYLRFTNAGTLTVSTATAFTAGEQVQIFNDSTALTVLPGTDVTIYGRGTAQGTAGFLAESQYDAFALVCVDTNAYRIIGNVTAVE